MQWPPRSLTVLALLLAFGILALISVIGIVKLWPEHQHLSGPRFAAAAQPKPVGARVTGVQEIKCPGRGQSGCVRARIQITEGKDRGKRSTLSILDAAGPARFAVGDAIYVYKNQLPPGARLGGSRVDQYSFSDFKRTSPLIWLAAAFALLVLVAGRVQGLRALVGLAGSLAMLVFFVVPAILGGRPPLQVAIFGAFGVMLLTIPLAHGANVKSLAACLGTALSLGLTLALADVFTGLAHLSGLTSDEAIYLHATSGVSLRGLLLAGMVIGALGVLGDTTVTQASTVLALRRANPALHAKELFTHATSVGRDHIAATVNTLVLAYAGAALPILLIFNAAGTSFRSAVNSEAVAEQIVATLVGSIGLIAAVPVTTALAALLALKIDPRELEREHLHAH
ncbi:MAG: hypothetical protein QOE29_990 [Gaiellaceae bacterium]|nr:hypothetical protein [Gaiellaceae bacterium]